jgi:hypothetical protein
VSLKPAPDNRFFLAPFAFFAAILRFGAAKVLLVASATIYRKM